MNISVLSRAETWVFDLDNTLYPADCRLFDQIERQIVRYLVAHHGVAEAEAPQLKTDLFQQYGTTLRGLMVEHGADPQSFLDFVHDLDLTPLDTAPGLGDVIAALPGRKVVFTNGSRGHAERVLARLGIDRNFDGIFDIVAAGFVPKPAEATYRIMLKTLGVRPAGAVMVEDMARNLKPAAALGMTTVWVPTDAKWSAEGGGDHVHHVAPNLGEFLREVVATVELT